MRLREDLGWILDEGRPTQRDGQTRPPLVTWTGFPQARADISPVGPVLAA